MRTRRGFGTLRVSGFMLAGGAGLAIAAAVPEIGFGDGSPPRIAGLSTMHAGRPSPAGTMLPRPDHLPAMELGPLAEEIVRLHAMVAAERARLDAFRDAQQGLLATLDDLRGEIAVLATRRDELLEDLHALRLRAEAACMPPDACGAPAEEPAPMEGAPPVRPMMGVAFLRPAPRDGIAARPAVTIHYRARSGAAREAAELVAEEARRAGFAEVSLRPVAQVPPTRTLRHRGDDALPEGERLVARLRARWRHSWTIAAAEDAAPDSLGIWLPH
jgi:hypothetical protein